MTLFALLAAPLALAASSARPLAPLGSRSPVGHGIAAMGGNLVAYDFAYRVDDHLAVDAGAGLRLGIGEELYPNFAATVGGSWFTGQSRLTVGPFLRTGASLPLATFEVFVATGVALRIQSRKARTTHTFSLGPGYFVVRDIPVSWSEQGPAMAYVRYAVHWFGEG